MKTHLLTFFLFVSVLSGCTEKNISSSIPSEQTTHDETSITYNFGEVRTDSITNCGTTRYISLYNFYFGVEIDDTHPITNLKFDLLVGAPGSQCADSTPLAFVAIDEHDNVLIGDVRAPRIRSSRGNNSEILLAVDLQIDQAVEGGICIVVETIDPPSNMEARFISVDSWQICNGDKCKGELATKVPDISPFVIPTPQFPSCDECNKESYFSNLESIDSIER